MHPVHLHKRLEGTVSALIQLTVTVDVCFHAQAGLYVAVTVTGDHRAVRLRMRVSFHAHPGDLGFRLNEVRLGAGRVLSQKEGVATLNGRRHAF